MKKILSCLLIICVSFFVFVGCGKAEENIIAVESVEKMAEQNVSSLLEQRENIQQIVDMDQYVKKKMFSQ